MGKKVETAGAVTGLVTLILLASTVSLLFEAWIVMLVWGALAPVLGGPTIGYGTSILVALGISLLSTLVFRPKLIT